MFLEKYLHLALYKKIPIEASLLGYVDKKKHVQLNLRKHFRY